MIVSTEPLRDSTHPLIDYGETILNGYRRFSAPKLKELVASTRFAVFEAVVSSSEPSSKRQLKENVLKAAGGNYDQATADLLSLLSEPDLLFMMLYPSEDIDHFPINSPDQLAGKARNIFTENIKSKLYALRSNESIIEKNDLDADYFLQDLTYAPDVGVQLAKTVENILSVLDEMPVACIDPHTASPIIFHALKDSYKYWRLPYFHNFIRNSKTEIPERILKFFNSPHLAPRLDSLERANYSRELIDFLYGSPRSDDGETVRLFTESACLLDKKAAQAAVYPHLDSSDPIDRNINDYCIATPEMRTETTELVNGVVTYYGHEYVVDDPHLKKGKYFADEILFGLVSIRDENGQPVCIIDASPFARPRKPMIAEPIGQEVIHPETLFYQAYARDVPASKEMLIDFLANYHSFYAPDGEFCQATQLGKQYNFNCLTMEPKFWIYHAFKSGQLNIKEITRFVKKDDAKMLSIFSSASESPQNFSTLYRLVMDLDDKFLENSWTEERARIKKWLMRKPSRDIDAVREVLNHLSEPISQEIAQHLPEEIATWTCAMESFSADVAQSILPPHERDLPYATKPVLELSNAILRRARRMTMAFAKFKETRPDWLLHNKELQYYHDGLQAQKALLDLLSLGGLHGLSEALSLPSYFFQVYRGINSESPEGQAALDSLLETWEAIYTLKASGKNMEAHYEEIRRFWQEENADIVAEGQQTGNTDIEVARDKNMLIHLNEVKDDKYSLPETVNFIDFGPWNGKRILAKLLHNCRLANLKIGRVVGIDVNRAPDPIPEMDLRIMPYMEAARQPDLVGQFDIAKSDWSACTEIPNVAVHMLNAAAYNHCLKMGGHLKLDTAYPEGQGSYDEAIRELKRLVPHLAEGALDFKYEGTDMQPKVFFIYYYEILFKIMEDAGFQIENIKLQDIKDGKYDTIINGQVDENYDYTDPYVTPIWRSRGRPRISIVAKKVKEASETQNIVLQQLYRGFFGGIPFTLPQMVEKVPENAA